MGLLNETLSEIVQNGDKITFSWYDYILFTVMLSVSAMIGIYFGCFGSKQSTAGEYLLGNHQMKVIPISVSLVASHISGITLLAIPADIYKYGAAYLMFFVSLFLMVIVTMYVYLPVFFKLQITSTYEYLERRFDARNRILASFLFNLSVFLYLPIVIYLPALAFSGGTGINVHYITPIVCGVCIFYTTIGGLKAVVWTDTLQFVVTFGSVMTVFVLGLRSTGGFSGVWAKAQAGDRANLFDFDPDPTKRDSFWTVICGITFHWIAASSINQTCVQKFLSLPTLAKARRSVIYYGIGVLTITFVSVFTGLIMYAKYADCDPFSTGQIERNDQLLPHYVMDVANHIPGLPGLFIAGVFSAALSTLSATLNCMAGTLYEDFVVKLTGQQSEKTSTNVLKLIVIVCGALCTLMVILVEKMGGILPLTVGLTSITAGPLIAMFTMGVFCPKISGKGCFWGTIAGLLVTSWIVFTAQYYKSTGILSYPSKPTSVAGCLANYTITDLTHNFTTPLLNATSIPGAQFVPFVLFRISFFYYTPIGMTVSIIFATVFTLIFRNDDPPVHRDLLTPVIYFLLPESQPKNKEYYGVDKALKLVTSEKDEKS